MIQKMNTIVGKWKLRYLLILLPIAFILRIVVNEQLNNMYEKSLFPVSFFEGQMTFNADVLAGYYAYMIEHNSLDVYLKTQLFDFVFIIATLFFHGVIGLILWKLHLKNDVNRRLAIGVFFAGIAAPLFDAIENAVSFLFISDTANITHLLTNLYSSFAAGKFALFGLTYLGASISIVNWLWIKNMKIK